MVICMNITYKTNSIKSKFFKLLVKISGFKKNTKTITDSIRYMNKCQQKQYDPKVFRDMKKNVYKEIEYYSYNEENRNRVLLYIHGGSFVDKPLKIQTDFVKKVAREIDAKLIIPLYKTLPNGNCEKFLTEMTELCEVFKEKNTKVFLIGDSAGGGAVLSLNMFLLEEKIDIIDGVILLSPWLDISLSNNEIKNKEKKDIVCSVEGNRFLGKKWADNIDIKDYKVSPLYGNVDKLKNVFISCGGNEVCQPDCLNFVDILKNKNINYKFVEFTKQFHNFEIYPIKESRILIDEIAEYIKEK